MASSPKTFVRYFIPQDGDSEDHPNVFPVSKPVDAICLRDIRAAFPLPGEYLFRFKAQFGKTHVWLDVTDDDAAAPRFERAIVAKVARLSFGSPARPSAGGSRAAPTPASASSSAQSRHVASASASTAAAPSPRAAKATSPPAAAAPAAPEVDDDVDFLGSAASDSTGTPAAADGADDLGGLFDGSHSAAPAPAAAPARAPMMNPAPRQSQPMRGSFMQSGGRGTPTSGRGTPSSAGPAASGSGDFSDLVNL